MTVSTCSAGRIRRQARIPLLSLWAFVAVILAPNVPEAKIDLTTLPDRGTIQLTIYNNEDITLVRERRVLSLAEGGNPLQFSWANTLIDPTSVQLDILEGDGVSIRDISYPANTTNTLIWNIEAEAATGSTVEISYFTSGITWEADYVVRSNPEETQLAIEGFVRVTNRSGEDYLDATTRLIVGDINLVERIADLARRGVPLPTARRQAVRDEMRMLRTQAMPAAPAPMAAGAMMESAFMDAAPKEVAKEGVGEYFLFTIEGTEDIVDGLSKRLPSFRADEVPVVVKYILDPRRFGSSITKLYSFVNDEENELGDSPLPNGSWVIFRETADGTLAWEARHRERYVPIGEKVELNLGSDGLIVLDERRMNFMRENLAFSTLGDVSGHDIVEDQRLILRNSKRVEVPVEIIRLVHHADFDFTPETVAGATWRKLDERTWELKATLPPLSESIFDYTLRIRNGSNARR